jgi:hypothetical protein
LDGAGESEAAEPLGLALGSAIGRRLSRCAALAGSGRQTAAQVVHGVRKDLKRVRALLRLVDDAGLDLRPVERTCADLARTIAAQRDADAVIETLDRLLERAKDDKSRLAVSHARQRLEARGTGETTAPTASLESLRGRLLQLRSDLAGADFARLDESALVAALARSHARCADERARLEARPKTRRFHALRKAVKRELHQREWLSRRVTGTGRGQVRLKELARLLGENQDLSILRAALESESLYSGRLRALVAAERRQLRAEARRLAAVLYPDQPG